MCHGVEGALFHRLIGCKQAGFLRCIGVRFEHWTPNSCSAFCCPSLLFLISSAVNNSMKCSTFAGLVEQASHSRRAPRPRSFSVEASTASGSARYQVHHLLLYACVEIVLLRVSFDSVLQVAYCVWHKCSQLREQTSKRFVRAVFSFYSDRNLAAAIFCTAHSAFVADNSDLMSSIDGWRLSTCQDASYSIAHQHESNQLSSLCQYDVQHTPTAAWGLALTTTYAWAVIGALRADCQVV